MASKRASLDAGLDFGPPKTRTPIAESKAKAFVEGKPSKAHTDASRNRRVDIDGVRCNVYVPREMFESLRMYAFQDRRSLSDAMTEALAEWLERRAKEQK